MANLEVWMIGLAALIIGWLFVGSYVVWCFRRKANYSDQFDNLFSMLGPIIYLLGFMFSFGDNAMSLVQNGEANWLNSLWFWRFWLLVSVGASFWMGWLAQKKSAHSVSKSRR